MWLAMVAWLSVDVLADPKGDATGSGATDDGLGSMYSVGQSIEDDGVALGEDDGVALVAVDLFSVAVEEGLCTANEPPRNSVQLDGEGDSLDTLYLWYTTLGDGMGRADGDVYNKGCWS